MTITWQKLLLPPNEIDLNTLLRCGQAFRWRKINNVWSCALNNQILLLRETDQDDTHILEYTTLDGSLPNVDTTKFIHSYFNTFTSNLELYKQWREKDTYFPVKSEGSTIMGVRILSQDPWETLLSFIISSNNNIKRISQLCEVLCIAYGKEVGYYQNLPYFTFPKPIEFLPINDPKELSSKHIETLEYELRGLGFGYRAKYISKTVRLMIENPEFWETLNNDNSWSEDGDEKCIEFLRQFPGVGPKVADCVALMGCKRHDLVPVDTHVWNILRSTYRKEFEKWVDFLSIKEEEGEDGAKKLTTKDKARTSEIPKSSLKRSLSNKAVDVKIYPFVKRFFREYWGVKAGWAQSVVFSEMVKLDNGINDVEEYEKLLDKVRSFKGDGFKRRKI